MLEALGTLWHWIFVALFAAVVLVIAWQIWRRHDQPQAYAVRTRARGWLGRTWDGLVRWLNS